MDRFVTVGGLTIDLTRIKTIKVKVFKILGKTNTVIVQFDSIKD